MKKAMKKALKSTSCHNILVLPVMGYTTRTGKLAANALNNVPITVF